MCFKVTFDEDCSSSLSDFKYTSLVKKNTQQLYF